MMSVKFPIGSGNGITNGGSDNTLAKAAIKATKAIVFAFIPSHLTDKCYDLKVL